MGKVYQNLSDRQKAWIAKQKIFFVATAPLSEKGLVNVSPKGLDSFRIIDDVTVAYLDLAGSGVETIAHIQENQRITIMFTAFDGPPMTLRLYGKGEILKMGSREFEEIKDHFQYHLGMRSIIKVNLNRIQDSCGWSIPLYDFKGDRDVYDKYCQAKSRDKIVQNIKTQNVESLDGLPGY